jgi:hypothetical protein
MSVYFPRISNEYLYIDISSVTQPLTISCWYKLDDITSHNPCVGINQGPGTYNTGYYLQAVGNDTGDPLRASHTAGATVKSSAISPYSSEIWQHGLAVFKNNYRLIYLNGVPGTENTDTLSGNTLDYVLIARGSIGTALNRYAKGYIAEVSIWNRDLDSSEASFLASGKSAELLPNGLIFHANLKDDLYEKITERFLNKGGSPTQEPSEHPNISYDSLNSKFIIGVSI